MTSTRDLNHEHQDNDVRQYAYDFDHVIRRYLLRTVERWIKSEGDTLEMGCYRGDMTEQILEYARSLTVMEGSAELAHHVQGRFGAKVAVINARFEEVELDGRFDTIFLVHTLEHLDEPVEVLAKIKRWLKPSGYLIVAVPNANALSRQIAVRMGLVAHNAAVTPAEFTHGHRRTYSLDVLLSHLRDAGLSVSECGGVLLKPLANFQFDKALASGVIDNAYLDACHDLARVYPEMSASIYAVCTR